MHGMCGRQEGGHAMKYNCVIVGILAVGVTNHGPSTAKHPNWRFNFENFQGNSLKMPLTPFLFRIYKRTYGHTN